MGGVHRILRRGVENESFQATCMNDASPLRDQIEECELGEVGRDDLKESFPVRMKPCCRTIIAVRFIIGCVNRYTNQRAIRVGGAELYCTSELDGSVVNVIVVRRIGGEEV
jgi:hypothetical protein